MSDHDEPSEAELFRRAMADVTPREPARTESRPTPPAPEPRQTRADERRVIAELLERPPEPGEVETGEELIYCQAGLQHRVLRKLRRGQYPPAAALDLHGLSAEQAEQAVSEFLREARARGLCCVRVIHGKGLRSSNRGPVLKARLARWLRRRDDVLAFCSARSDDGGTGAVYVLLRRR